LSSKKFFKKKQESRTGFLVIFRIFQKKAKKRQLFQELGIKILFIVQNETRKVRAIR